jgi:glycosyltransferase involved in cell wall biosynthesis
MRTVLHVGNIAQNGFLNAKLLNEHGWDCDVLCADYYHFGGSPAWLSLAARDIQKHELGDDFFPNFFRFAETASANPRWFAQGPQIAAITYLWLRRNGPRDTADAAWSVLTYLRFKATALRTTAPFAFVWQRFDFDKAIKDLGVAPEHVPELEAGWQSEALQNRMRDLVREVDGEDPARYLSYPLDPQLWTYLFERYRLLHDLPDLSLQSARNPAQQDRLESIADFRKMQNEGLTIAYGVDLLVPAEPMPDTLPDAVLPEDTVWISGVRPTWKALWPCYRYRVNYATTVTFGLLSGGLPYAGFEHGTIRSIPFEDNVTGRLTRRGYQAASAVLITNADYIKASPRLEFEEHRKVWCPHRFDQDALAQFNAEFKRPRKSDLAIHFFAPARHDWTRGDVHNDKANDRIVHAVASLVREGCRKFVVTFIRYGKDCDATVALISELRLDSWFAWIDPLPNNALWRTYVESHAVLDQFHIPAIGGVGLESLALGCRLITHDNGCLATFFNEQPPLLPACSADDIARQMRRVLDDPVDAAGMGRAAADWFQRRHGPANIIAAFRRAFELIDEDYAAMDQVRAAP